MIHSNEKIIKHKIGLLNLAEELENVSKACKIMGVSRDTFYRYQDALKEAGIQNLLDKSRCQPNLKNRSDPEIEEAVIPMPLKTLPQNRLERAMNCVN